MDTTRPRLICAADTASSSSSSRAVWTPLGRSARPRRSVGLGTPGDPCSAEATADGRPNRSRCAVAVALAGTTGAGSRWMENAMLLRRVSACVDRHHDCLRARLQPRSRETRCESRAQRSSPSPAWDSFPCPRSSLSWRLRRPDGPFLWSALMTEAVFFVVGPLKSRFVAQRKWLPDGRRWRSPGLLLPSPTSLAPF